jgi:hypothetical protein
MAETDTLINNTVRLIEGSSFTRPVNSGTAKNISGAFLYSFPFEYIKSNIALNLTVSYSQYPSFLNNRKFLSNNNNLSSYIKINSSASEKVDYEISYKACYSVMNNSIQSETDQNYFTGNFNLKIYAAPISKLVISSDFSMINYYGIDLYDANNKAVWNASIAWKFLKHNYGELKFSVHDLLRSDTSVSRTITNNYIEDKESTVLQQYFLITFSYKIKYLDI